MNWLRFLVDSPATPKGVEPAEANPKAGVYFETAWSRRPWARTIRRASVYGFMKPAIGFYGAPRVIGTDRLDDVEGPVLFAANHHSHADTTLLLATIPGRFREHLAIVAAADYFFPNRLVATASALFLGAIPMERQKLSKLSIENAIEAVKGGCNLLVFPEGGRSPDGWGQKHRPGAAFVAKRTNIPVVPIYLDGTGRILPKGRNWPKRSRCAVVFGQPMHLEPGEDARAFAGRVEARVSELADEFDHGWWSALRRSHEGQTPPLDGPRVAAWRRRWALGSAPGTKKQDDKPRWPQI